MEDGFYALDRETRIQAIGGGMIGDAGCSTRWIGRSLWEFIEGPETQAFLSTAFSWCRVLRESFTTHYRMDGADESHLLRMTVTPGDEGRLRVLHRVIAKGAGNLGGLHADPRTECRCATCDQLRFGADWIKMMVRPAARDFPRSHVLCSDCAARRVGIVDGIGGGKVMAFPRRMDREGEGGDADCAS